MSYEKSIRTNQEVTTFKTPTVFQKQACDMPVTA